MHTEIKRHLMTIGLLSVIGLPLVTLFFIIRAQIEVSNRAIPLSADAIAVDSFITTAAPSQELTVQTRSIAEKVNLQRKLLTPSSSQSSRSIERIVINAGGEVLSDKSSSIVVFLPKEKEAEVLEKLEEQQLTTSVEIDYPVAIASNTVGWNIWLK
jgi:hypothetical protein